MLVLIALLYPVLSPSPTPNREDPVFYVDGHVRVDHGSLTALPRRYVARFFCAMLSTGAVAWAFFYVWPSGSVRLPMAEISWYYHAVITADAPLNSFPCLHAASSVVAACALLHGPLPMARAWQRCIWALVALICVAAIALRQHADFDVPEGSRSAAPRPGAIALPLLCPAGRGRLRPGGWESAVAPARGSAPSRCVEGACAGAKWEGPGLGGPGREGRTIEVRTID